jgi:hypothetical protein
MMWDVDAIVKRGPQKIGKHLGHASFAPRGIPARSAHQLLQQVQRLLVLVVDERQHLFVRCPQIRKGPFDG